MSGENARYKLKGSRTQGEKTNRVVLSRDRVLVLNGDSVELSESEHKQLSKKYILHKTSGPSSSSGSNDDKSNIGGE